MTEFTLTDLRDPRSASSLLTDAHDTDGVAAFSEQFVVGLTDPRLGHRHLAAYDGERLVGLLADDGESAELVVAPAARGQGVASELLRRSRVRHVWAHGDLVAARRLASELGFAPSREMLVMGVSGDRLTADTLGFAPPRGFEVTNLHRAAKRYGRDTVLRDWLAANNEAFAWHPEQGGWDLARLERGMEADWFAEEDVLFLYDAQAGTMAGFHWTKWHLAEVAPGAPYGARPGEFGEVYVVGLAEAYRGQHLGGPLVQAGLAHLVGRGANNVILYVESDNDDAVKAYRRLGFEVVERHVVYSLPKE